MMSRRFLEYGEYKGNLYGTSIASVREVLNSGKICVIDIEPNDEDFQEMEEAARKMESNFCQFFDHVIVNDDQQDSCVQLLAAARKAQDEPQWVPASWIRPPAES
ncbi:hypothetical protein FQN60_006732 [Etheostoma spectabile]|uniref:Guanylate kinase-like domain-containing protein n=1 Tax=Etheostoma spectabile TaxID=54343 RepID=A0A5J5CGS2_9PERO|nr:hypothetical protein FQN60_006732 [Etheostoma spectabile]